MTTATANAAAKLSDDPSAAPIPFTDLQAQRRRLGTRIDEAIARVLDHGKFIMGPEVARLEEELVAFCGAKHAITCSSGTDALLLILMAWEVRPGDAIFVPSFTFAATAEVVALLGATPVFCDVLEHSYNLDPESLETAIGYAKNCSLRPRAVIAVDLFGQPADYRRILPLARKHGLMVLADSAQSFGATLDGKAVGTLGDATAVSFFPAKPLGCYGDGGAVLTDDDDLAQIIISLRVHGKGSDKYDNARIGINGRLDTVQAAILIEKLAIFEEELVARQAVAERYTTALSSSADVPTLISGATSVWAQYTIRLGQREFVAARLFEQRIPTAVHYPKPLHLQTAYFRFPKEPSGLPVSVNLSRCVLSLPMHPYLEPVIQDAILETLVRAIGR